MKRFLPFIMLMMTASVANAGGLVSSQSSSVQLTVEAARSTAIRMGNSYSINGTNVGTSDGTTAGVLSTGTVSGGVYAPGNISASQLSATNGESFSFNTSFTQGDAIPSSAATVGQIPNFSNVTSYTAGVAGSLAGTIDNAHNMTITAGGAGTTATGQFVSEVTVID
jgi:hypothetical protein